MADSFIETPNKKQSKKKINYRVLLFFFAFILVIFGGFQSFIILKNNTKTQIIIQEPTVINSKKVINVDISGAIAVPGIYQLEDGSRVYELVEKAGNILETADLEWVQKKLNLAKKIYDEEKIYIPFEGENYLSQENSVNASLININTATINDLISIPGIGDKIAKDIIDYRDKNGLFEAIESIKKVPGIGDKTYEKISNYLIVE